jgi:hypothetical protein
MHKRRQVCRELYRAKALEEQSVRQIRHIGREEDETLLKLLTDRRGRWERLTTQIRDTDKPYHWQGD